MKISSLLGHTQEVFTLVRSSDKPVDSIIDSFFRAHKYLGSHDRKFIAETVYGTLRHLRYCDEVCRLIVNSIGISVSVEVGTILLIVTYLIQIAKNGQVTTSVLKERLPSSKHKFGEEFTERVKTYSLQLPEERLSRLGIQYSFPDWMVQKFDEQYGTETEALLSSLNQSAPLTIRVNTIKTAVEECQQTLKKEGIENERTKYSPYGLNVPKRINLFSFQSFRNGLYEVQDEGSQLLPLILDPKPTARVLDLCAGAGGKTLMFSMLMKNRGEILATDVSGYRLNELRKRAKRAGAFNIRIKEINGPEDLIPEYRESFDIVFIDAPCSGLGTLRRNPGMKWTVTAQTVEEITQKQKQLINGSVALVKPGGILAYATCTLLKEENEDVVEEFLKSNRGFEIIKPKPLLEKWVLGEYEGDKYIKLLPHKVFTDGFFMVLLNI